MTAGRALLWPVVTALLTLAAASAAAQADVEGTGEEQARVLFTRGLELADGERWVEALDHFRRSSALIRRPSTVFNVATALYRLGRLTEAVLAFDEYLQMAGGPEEAERSLQAVRMRREASAAIAVLTLRVEPATAEVRIGGVVRAETGAERMLELDPGEHLLRVSATNHSPTELRVSVAAGEEAERSVTLDRLQSVELSPSPPATTPIAGADTPRTPSRDQTRSGGVLTEWWFWTVLGAAVAAGVAVTLALSSGDTLQQPLGGTRGVVVETLRWP